MTVDKRRQTAMPNQLKERDRKSVLPRPDVRRNTIAPKIQPAETQIEREKRPAVAKRPFDQINAATDQRRLTTFSTGQKNEIKDLTEKLDTLTSLRRADRQKLVELEKARQDSVKEVARLTEAVTELEKVGSMAAMVD